MVELLADAPDLFGSRVDPLPAEGNIYALIIPHSSIVVKLHQVPGESGREPWRRGKVVEMAKPADLVSFTCLIAFTFDQRFERKDIHDLIFHIEHAEERPVRAG
ncbi:MAG: hypothetical protein OXC26_07540 [Albidovulum sp.]|nr:hypothetical protein [Albidovulum sp.]